MSSRQQSMPMLTPCADLAQAEAIWEQLTRESPVHDAAATFLGFRLWISHFYGARPLPLLMLQLNGAGAALLPVQCGSRVILGMNFRVMHAPCNPHWRSTYPIVGARPDLAISALLAGLLDRRNWDLLEIGPMLSSCPLVHLLLAHGQQLDMAPEICGQYDDPIMRLTGTWQDYHATLSRRVRAQVRHGEVRLARQGSLCFEEYRGGPELQARLSEFYRVEASGWKGQQGTAILSNPVTHAFYTDLAHAAAACNWLRLYFLRVDGRCIAANYCLAHRDTLYMLKVGYDEAWAPCSPGHVLRKRLIQHLLTDRQIRVLDLMMGGGDHQAYKARWANQIRQYVVLRLFNPRTPRGRLARRLARLRYWLRGQELEPSAPFLRGFLQVLCDEHPISSRRIHAEY